MIAQNQGASDTIESDTNSTQKKAVSIKPAVRESELFPQGDGKEVLEMKADSTYYRGLKPGDANKIPKPKKKKGVKVSSKDCPVT